MTSIPEPAPGLVVSFAYLWQHEATAGRVEGSKDRPAVVVLAAETGPAGGKTVLVAPITHSLPSDLAAAVEIPAETKRRLGLDTDRSWVIVSEVNRFVWPGPDLRPVSPERWAYGPMPPGLFAIVRRRLLELFGRRRLVLVRRDP